jgi:hypothetical protein
LVGVPKVLPLDASPMYEIAIRDPQAELPALRESHPDHAEALVNLHVHYTAGVDALEDVLRQLDAVFPRWCARDWTERSGLGPALTVGEATASVSFDDTVREYLIKELQNHREEDRVALMELAEGLLREMA